MCCNVVRGGGTVRAHKETFVLCTSSIAFVYVHLSKAINYYAVDVNTGRQYILLYHCLYKLRIIPSYTRTAVGFFKILSLLSVYVYVTNC